MKYANVYTSSVFNMCKLHTQWVYVWDVGYYFMWDDVGCGIYDMGCDMDYRMWDHHVIGCGMGYGWDMGYGIGMWGYGDVVWIWGYGDMGNGWDMGIWVMGK
jgi:hypothetical protein